MAVVGVVVGMSLSRSDTESKTGWGATLYLLLQTDSFFRVHSSPKKKVRIAFVRSLMV